MNSELYNDKWKAMKEEISLVGGNADAVIEALRDHHEMYSDSLLEWLAKLYSKGIGGFYYSNSARDNSGFLPDVESTLQALNLIHYSGIIDSDDELPKAMRRKIAMFVCSLLDIDDGYIYHPQWGKDITDSRRGRDLQWAVDLSHRLKFKLPYPTANERLKQNLDENDQSSVIALPEYLRSKKAFIEYLEKFDWKTNSYYSGNNLAAQVRQLSAAGLLDTAIDFLEDVRNKENGLWAEKPGYDAVNGAFKISFLYQEANRPFNYADKVVMTAMDCITSFDEPTVTTCYIYNTWYTISNLLSNAKNSASSDRGADFIEKVNKECLLRAPEAIRATSKKLAVFMKKDGSFSMCPHRTAALSQGAPVARRLPNGEHPNEGDINATVIASTSTNVKIFECLGFGGNKIIPLYSKDSYSAFFYNLKY